MANISVIWLALLAFVSSLVLGQQVFEPRQGPAARTCGCIKHRRPTYTTKPFTYAMTTTVRYATSVPKPTTKAPTYAPPAKSATPLISSARYTTWGKWDPKGRKAIDLMDPYGQAAWSKLWELANPPNFPPKTSVYSTTVQPTPVPSSELVLAPRDYFGPTDCYNFPPGFMYGVAGAAAQIEGAIADQGKAPALPDIFGAIPGMSNNYLTNEHYYYYKQDIERLAAMGVKYYSFSISWTRILPFALPGTPVNQEGLDHYNDVINFVLEKGMVPVITLVHFDPPLQVFGSLIDKLDGLAYFAAILGQAGGGNSTAGLGGFLPQDGSLPDVKKLVDLAKLIGLGGLIELTGLGGQTKGSPVQHNATFQEAFLNYAKIAMAHYADRVPLWVTFNEPELFYFDSKAVDAIIKSHASVYHFYKEELKGTGNITLKLANNFGVPLDPKSEADVFAADYFNSFAIGTFADPIFLGKDYPESFKALFPYHIPLTEADLKYIHGTADIMAIDHYTSTVVSSPVIGDKESVRACASNKSHPLRAHQCVKTATVDAHGWSIGYRSQSYVYTTPTYLRSYLNYIYDHWHKPIALMEFGFPVFGEADKKLSDQLFDTPRSTYYLSFLSEMLKAIWEDGVEVVAAFSWSFADNWEWGDFKPQFGMQAVNRTTQQRLYKKSFFDVVDFVRARGA